MSKGIFNNLPALLHTFNVTRTMISTTTTTTTMATNSFLSLVELTTNAGTQINSSNTVEISAAACFGFVVLILATVLGNSLVLLALYLDKRLHSPSFYLIANMAVADLLLGLAVLPFSSVLELLKERWIFGQSFCSAWLALDVLCCTASIMALMAVSIDRYIGVTRPLNYGSIMTTRRTIYLIIVVWAVSILTSDVPLFGLTDRENKSNDPNLDQERLDAETCKVNKDTFYTIFSSLISFYIPVIILLILYSRVYQEAKTQGKKLENERRRLFQIDYQIASEHLRRKQTFLNGHTSEQALNEQHSLIVTPRTKRSHSNAIDHLKSDGTTTALIANGNMPNEEFTPNRTLTATDAAQLRKDYSDFKDSLGNDDTITSGSSMAHHFSQVRRSIGQRISSTLKHHPQSISHYHQSQSNPGQMSPNDELLIIKRKLHNLKREKKAFRTLGLILSALLICWLPFFVTLPLMSILRENGMVNDEKTENTWFKIAFWLGYCNSALNPFVYAFSNRAIRRAFRQVLFRRYCCCNLRCWLCLRFCPEKSRQYDSQQSCQYERAYSNSFAAQNSQVSTHRNSSLAARTVPTSIINSFESQTDTPKTTGATSGGGPVVSFAEFLAEPDTDEKENTSTSVPVNTKD